jgi:hypothetical protein
MISKLFIALFSFVLLYFAHLATTTAPVQLGEIDSLTYHIPMAEAFAKGNLKDLFHIPQGLGYYPGVGEIVLGFLIKLGIPLGFFNLLSIVLLFLGLRKLGQVFRLGKEYSTIFAASVCLLPSVIRLVPTQKIDIWMATFFVCSILLLKNPKKSLSYFLKLGVVLGMLIGVKFSGILIVLVLFLVFFKDILVFLNLKRFLGLTLPIFVIGGYWYARNYILFNNPFFPVGLFSFSPHPGFTNIVWNSLAEHILTKRGLALILQAYLSEFLIWSFAPLVVIYYFVSTKVNSISKDFKSMASLSFFLFLTLFPQPAGLHYQSAVSFMRFLFPFMITLILLIFMIAKQANKTLQISFIALLSSVAVLPQFDYRPKLIITWLVCMGIMFITPIVRKK